MKRPTHPRALGAAGVALSLLLAACASPETTRPNEMAPGLEIPPVERLRDAHVLATEAYESDDPVEAERRYRSAAATYPEYPAVWNNLGVTLMEQSRFAEADEAFARAAELAPRDPRPAYNRGLIRFDLRRPREALDHFEDALSRDPNYLAALRGAIRCDILLQNGSDLTVERARRALMLEQDEKWSEYLKQQLIRLEAELARQ